MSNIYQNILQSKSNNQKLLAILLDPDKIDRQNLSHIISKINQSPATHIFIGGSQVFCSTIDGLISEIKQHCSLPIILFPGNPSQISNKADGILFLSLISGRNPDFLIGHQVKAAPILKESNLEIIPTGYILIDGNNETAVAKISRTHPMPIENPDAVLATAQAGEMLGKKLIYLEAGSGAKNPVPTEIITMISQNIEIPLIVGGGIVTLEGIKNAYGAGADIVVIGTAFENNANFFTHD